MSIDRDQVAKGLAEELGWSVHEDGSWYQLDEDSYARFLPDMTRDALIDARCRVEELEEALAAAIQLCGG